MFSLLNFFSRLQMAKIAQKLTATFMAAGKLCDEVDLLQIQILTVFKTAKF